jgi:hypothetical protein
VGQPARNRAYRKVHFDKRKADPAESMACARFAIVERPPATPHNRPEFRQLRDTVALLEANSKQQTRLVNQLHGLLRRVRTIKGIGPQTTAALVAKIVDIHRFKDCDFDPEFETRQPLEATQDADEKQKAAGHKQAVEPPGKVVTATDPCIPPSATNNKLPPLDFAKLRQQVSILQVLEQISWHPVAMRGAQWRGTCPVHEKPGTKSRSFAVHTEKNAYCCYRCGTRGNALDLWTALQQKPLLEAAWDLVETWGLEPVKDPVGDRQKPPPTGYATSMRRPWESPSRKNS